MDAEEIEFLPIKEFAARHQGRIKKSTIGLAVRRSEMPHIRLGKRIYIPANALTLMQEEQEAQRQATLRKAWDEQAKD
jgi:hypothetical protein